jgi:hypothetical protein
MNALGYRVKEDLRQTKRRSALFIYRSIIVLGEWIVPGKWIAPGE